MRLGGDEFAILCYEQNDRHAETLAKQIEEQISELSNSTKEPYRLSLIIGWARFLSQVPRTRAKEVGVMLKAIFVQENQAACLRKANEKKRDPDAHQTKKVYDS